MSIGHGMIDLHCHILPGIDDGPGTIEGSLGAFARAAAAAGINTIVATPPHVNGRYHNEAATIAPLVEEVNALLAAEDVAVEVLPRVPRSRTSAAEIEPGELSPLRLGAGPWLLIEPPFATVAVGLDTAVGEIQRSGHRVLLAHPERFVPSRFLDRDPGDARGDVAAPRGRRDIDHRRLARRRLRRHGPPLRARARAQGADPQRHIRRTRPRATPPRHRGRARARRPRRALEWLTPGRPRSNS